MAHEYHGMTITDKDGSRPYVTPNKHYETVPANSAGTVIAEPDTSRMRMVPAKPEHVRAAQSACGVSRRTVDEHKQSTELYSRVFGVYVKQTGSGSRPVCVAIIATRKHDGTREFHHVHNGTIAVPYSALPRQFNKHIPMHYLEAKTGYGSAGYDIRLKKLR